MTKVTDKESDVTVPVSVPSGDIVKANALIEGIYNKMTLWELYMFHGVLVQIKASEKIDFNRMIYLSGQEMAYITGTAEEAVYGKMRIAGKKLVKTSIIVDTMPDGTYRSELGHEDEIMLFQLCRYKPNEGRLGFKFTPDILPYISDLSGRYTRLQTFWMMRFKSKYAMRIFELCHQYAEKRKSKEFSINELRRYLGAEEKYPLMERFRARILTPAIRDINRYSDIRASFRLVKKGKEIKSIIFQFAKLSPEEIEARLRAFPEDYRIYLDSLTKKDRQKFEKELRAKLE